MRGFKIDRRGAVVIERTFPARHADAPFIARLQSGEAPLWTRRNQIISIEHGEIEKFPRCLYADGVQPDILWARSTKSIAIKSSHRIATTTFQLSS